MDIKLITREMLKNGQGKDEIVANLQELGVDDPEKYYEEAVRSEGRGIVSPKLNAGTFKEILPPGEEGDAEGEAKEILESETRPLFETQKKSMFSNIGRKEPDPLDEIPKLEITTIGDEGERTASIGDMLGKGEPDIVKKMPVSSLQNLDEVERKLDEMISLLKAVYEIDRKILEANRNVLLRLKEGKT